MAPKLIVGNRMVSPLYIVPVLLIVPKLLIFFFNLALSKGLPLKLKIKKTYLAEILKYDTRWVKL